MDKEHYCRYEYGIWDLMAAALQCHDHVRHISAIDVHINYCLAHSTVSFKRLQGNIETLGFLLRRKKEKKNISTQSITPLVSERLGLSI